MTRWRIAFAVACGVHLVALYAPLPVSPGPSIRFADKAVHVLLFATVAYLGARSRLPLRWLVGVLLADAVVSEVVHQVLLPARAGEVQDAVADVVGVAVGIWAAGGFARSQAMMES